MYLDILCYINRIYLVAIMIVLVVLILIHLSWPKQGYMEMKQASILD